MNLSSLKKTEGAVLLAVLVVMMLTSMVVVSLLYQLRAESGAAAAGRRVEQAWGAAMSGIYYAARLASEHPFEPEVWLDNPTELHNRLVYDDGIAKWYFTVYWARDVSQTVTAGVRYGLSDEASRLNVNEAELESLRRLPATDEGVVEALIAHSGEHSLARAQQGRDPSPAAAARDHASFLGLGGQRDDDDRVYDNAPTRTFSNLNALLSVDGWSWATLYGEDANLNFLLERTEDDGDVTLPLDNQNGRLDRGLSAFLTVRNDQWAVDQRNAKQVDLNGPLEPLATNGLTEQTLEFLRAVRKARPASRFRHPVELLNAVVKLDIGEEGNADDESKKRDEPQEVRSGVGVEDIAFLLDRVTTEPGGPHASGRLNVHTASAAVLSLLPGIDESLADAIVASRDDLELESRKTIAWLLEKGLVDADKFREIAPQLTARSFQYRMRVVGYGLPAGNYRVLEAVVDVGDGAGAPRIRYLRDLTRLGLPLPLLSSEEENGG